MPPKTTHRRETQPWLEWLVSGNWQDYENSPTYSKITGVSTDDDVTVSSSHQFSLLGRYDNEDIGGDFRVIKRGYSENSSLAGPLHFSQWPPYYHPMNPGVNHIYCDPKARVGFVDRDSIDIYKHPPHVSTGLQLDVYGAKAIARSIPTNPVAEAQVLAGNTLQKGLPKIPFRDWEHITKSAKYAGDNYLNATFGWKPFVNDLQNLARAIKERNKILGKFHAESGKLLHRSYHFPTETITDIDHRGNGYIPAPFGDSDYFRGDHVGRLTVTSTTSIQRWFSGAFTYYLPKLGSLQGRIADANKLLGAGITPELVWELTPWSWAVNWFVDTSDVIHNLSQFLNDGLVMPYAYIMEYSKTVVEYNLDMVAFKSYPGFHSFSQTFSVECKQRRAATPWGFGVNFDGFSDRQLAIMAALGLSHRSGQGTINPDG